MTYQIGWFSTGRGQGSMNLLNAMVNAVGAGEVSGSIAFVVCSREQGEAEGSDRYIQQVQEYGIPLITFSSKKFMPELRSTGKADPAAMRQWRVAYDREVMQRTFGLRAYCDTSKFFCASTTDWIFLTSSLALATATCASPCSRAVIASCLARSALARDTTFCCSASFFLLIRFSMVSSKSISLMTNWRTWIL